MDSERREALAARLHELCPHRETVSASTCSACNIRSAHLTPLLAQEWADGAADLANAWQWGGWADALLSPSPNGTLATAQAVTDWLRDRAAALAPSTPRRAEPGVQGGDGEGAS